MGTEVAHVTRDSNTTIKIKRSKVKAIRPLWLPVQVTTYMDNLVYATAQSEPLPVDLGAGAYRGGRPSTAR